MRDIREFFYPFAWITLLYLHYIDMICNKYSLTAMGTVKETSASLSAEEPEVNISSSLTKTKDALYSAIRVSPGMADNQTAVPRSESKRSTLGTTTTTETASDSTTVTVPDGKPSSQSSEIGSAVRTSVGKDVSANVTTTLKATTLSASNVPSNVPGISNYGVAENTTVTSTTTTVPSTAPTSAITTAVANADASERITGPKTESPVYKTITSMETTITLLHPSLTTAVVQRIATTAVQATSSALLSICKKEVMAINTHRHT